MKPKTQIAYFLFVAAAAACLSFAACARDGTGSSPTAVSVPADGHVITVVTTIYPVTYFTQRIAGDRAEVVGVVPQGIEAHDFEPKPSDLRAIQDASVVVYDHPEFESWMADALKSAASDTTVVQAGGDGASGESDPHV